MNKRGSFFRVLLGVFGTTIGVQFLGLLSQMLIARYFGVSRQMDLYVLVLSIAMMSVFAFGGIFDNVAVPFLVQAREAGAERLRALAGQFVVGSALFALAVSLLFLAVLPLLLPVIGAGLSARDRAGGWGLGLAFLPWTLTSIPYYALVSVHKAQHRFRRALSGELVVVAASLLAIVGVHSSIAAVPLAYGAGYTAALLWVVWGVGIEPAWPRWRGEAGIGALSRQSLQLFATRQVASLGSLIERWLQSYLGSGALSAWSYSSLVVNNSATLLGFREVFIVPLSVHDGRVARLERVLIGLTMLSVPAAAAVMLMARPIVTILFMRGRFGAQAADLTGTFLAIQAVGLWPGTAGAPLLRMLQILDRAPLIGIIYIVGALGVLLLGGVFVLGAHGGPVAFAAVMVASSTLSTITAGVLVHRAGLRPDWMRVARYAAFALAAAAAGLLASRFAPPALPLYPRLACQLALFGLPIVLAYAAIRQRLLAVIR